jgi:hypothetical protein
VNVIRKEEERVNRMSLRWVAALAAMMVLGTALALAEEPPAAAPAVKKPTYVGSKACKACHMGEKKGRMWEIWQESKHAKSFAALDSAKGQTQDPKCLKCHTTGYGAGGYGTAGMEALSVPEGLCSVGCEACHGPGSEYKSSVVMKDRAAAIKAGLMIPDEKVCVTCHNAESPTFKGFKYDEYVAKVAHKLPPKAPDTTGTAPKQ